MTCRCRGLSPADPTALRYQVGERWEMDVSFRERWDRLGRQRWGRREYVRCVECEKVGLKRKEIKVLMSVSCYVWVEGGLVAEWGEVILSWLEEGMRRAKEREETEDWMNEVGNELPLQELDEELTRAEVKSRCKGFYG